jgi:4-hydroxy-tetrahydrodipicolinate synthase
MRAPDAIDRDWVRRSLTGPITAVHPVFARDGAIDGDGIRTEIEHNLAAGSGVMLLTWGDSLHTLLTDEEVGDLVKLVVAHTRGRALVVAADRQWWTGKEVAFADFARDAGADILMVLPPNFGMSVTHDSLVDHYRAVAAHIPVMLVTNLFATNHDLGLRVIRTLLDTAPNVVAIKEDVTGDFAKKVALATHEQWAVISGGMKQNHFDMAPYGCDGYMSTLLHFIPAIPHAYWRAVQAADLSAVGRIIAAYDNPWFEMAFAEAGNFDATFHASQEVFGIGGRWRRAPYHTFTDEQMERLRGFYAALPRIQDVVPEHAGADRPSAAPTNQAAPTSPTAWPESSGPTATAAGTEA